MIRRWARETRGATSLEYALMGSLIAVVVAVAIGATGTRTNALYTQVGTAFNAAAP